MTRTSKAAGRRTSSIAHESTSWWSSATSGMLRRDLVDDRPPQPRRREDVGLVDGRHVTCGASAASSNASRTTRRTSASEYGRVSSAVRAAPAPVASRRSPK